MLCCTILFGYGNFLRGLSYIISSCVLDCRNTVLSEEENCLELAITVLESLCLDRWQYQWPIVGNVLARYGLAHIWTTFQCLLEYTVFYTTLPMLNSCNHAYYQGAAYNPFIKILHPQWTTCCKLWLKCFPGDQKFTVGDWCQSRQSKCWLCTVCSNVVVLLHDNARFGYLYELDSVTIGTFPNMIVIFRFIDWKCTLRITSWAYTMTV